MLVCKRRNIQILYIIERSANQCSKIVKSKNHIFNSELQECDHKMSLIIYNKIAHHAGDWCLSEFCYYNILL